jgi:AcrR family transcriptional regulator
LYLEIMKRSYRLKQRAEGQDQTRQKIVDAAIQLHQAKGLSATSMNDIAQRAQVAKVTVYRHFPDVGTLVNACSGQYFQRHPFPDSERWRQINNPLDRFRLGLRETYAYHQSTEPMVARVLGEARDHPVMEPYHEQWQRAVAVLASAWPDHARENVSLKAALALALSFDTWRLLSRTHQLTDDEVIDLMTRLVCDCSANTRLSGPAMLA